MGTLCVGYFARKSLTVLRLTLLLHMVDVGEAGSFYSCHSGYKFSTCDSAVHKRSLTMCGFSCELDGACASYSYAPLNEECCHSTATLVMYDVTEATEDGVLCLHHKVLFHGQNAAVYQVTLQESVTFCDQFGPSSRLAAYDDLDDAYRQGDQMCHYGWISESSLSGSSHFGKCFLMMQTVVSGCGGQGVYGIYTPSSKSDVWCVASGLLSGSPNNLSPDVIVLQ